MANWVGPIHIVNRAGESIAGFRIRNAPGIRAVGSPRGSLPPCSLDRGWRYKTSPHPLGHGPCLNSPNRTPSNRWEAGFYSPGGQTRWLTRPVEQHVRPPPKDTRDSRAGADILERDADEKSTRSPCHHTPARFTQSCLEISSVSTGPLYSSAIVDRSHNHAPVVTPATVPRRFLVPHHAITRIASRRPHRFHAIAIMSSSDPKPTGAIPDVSPPICRESSPNS